MYLFDKLPLLLFLEKFLFLGASTLRDAFNVALANGIQMGVPLSSLQLGTPLLLFCSALLFRAPLPVENAFLFEGRVLLDKRSAGTNANDKNCKKRETHLFQLLLTLKLLFQF